MPIDRGPWNALIDDDGSNLVGSVWNKAAIKTVLLDPIDGAVPSEWVSTVYAGSDYAASAPMTWTVEAGDVLGNWYTKSGRVLSWSVNISGSVTGGSAGTTLYVKVPEGLRSQRAIREQGRLYTAATGWIPCDVQVPVNALNAAIVKPDGTNLSLDANLYLFFHLELPYA